MERRTVFLQADIALRQQSNGKVGLNDILLKLNHCCINSSEVWTGLELATQLDQFAGKNIFTSLYHSYATGYTFPDFRKTYAELGITISQEKDPSGKKQRLFELVKGSLSDCSRLNCCRTIYQNIGHTIS
ncbi:MAG: hypothetical protein Q9M92_06225 [Enterobacterales bacterium]|nr:hypothetical protein [Enterobacterales bacterium]